MSPEAPQYSGTKTTERLISMVSDTLAQSDPKVVELAAYKAQRDAVMDDPVDASGIEGAVDRLRRAAAVSAWVWSELRATGISAGEAL